MSENNICISTETFKFEIELNLNHAKAALTTENPTFCQMGLVALAKALALAELVADHREQLIGKDVHLFAGYKEQCVRLINAFWQDFGLVCLQRVSSSEITITHVQPAERPAKPVVARPRPQEKTRQQAQNETQKPGNGNGKQRSHGYHKIDPVIKQHILDNLTPPAGVTRSAWFKQLAEEYDITDQTIANWCATRDNGQPAD